MVEAQAISTYSLLADTGSKTGSPVKNRVWAVAGSMGLKQVDVLTGQHSFARSDDINTLILKEQQELTVQSWNRLIHFLAIELKQALTQPSGVKVELPAGSSRPRWSWNSLHSSFPYIM